MAMVAAAAETIQNSGASSMGQGDKKTRKGKIWRGSYGNTRKHKPVKKKPAPGLAKGKKK
jgi:ribosomal small subunit protein bTHX